MTAVRYTALAVVVAVTVVVAMLAAPRWRFGGIDQSASGCAEYLNHISRLEAEVVRLRQALQEAVKAVAVSKSTASGEPSKAVQVQVQQQVADQLKIAKPSSVDPIVTIDLMKFLGTRDYYDGISFDTFRCAPPIKQGIPPITEEETQDVIKRFKDEVHSAASNIFGIPKDKFKTDIPLWANLAPNSDIAVGEALLVRDPRVRTFRDTFTHIMGRYLVWGNHSLALQCNDSPKVIEKASELGRYCRNLPVHEAVAQIGYHANPQETIDTVVNDAVVSGTCTKHPDMKGSYGEWLKEERMHNPEWKTFNVENEEQDHVMLLLDVLYEKLGIFKNQYWLGVITMQNPFDMMSIADIIYTVKPDLIIETGTANGGSALLWSSIMEISGMEGGKIVTMDMGQPSWAEGQQHWGGMARQDPTKHPYWAKRVEFLQGDTVSIKSRMRVEQLAKEAKSVLVLLDSDHSSVHVKKEMDAYCHLVTPGSYCIVEDTKMSRWSTDGPLESVKAYMKGPGGKLFEMDRSRELLYSHHVMGYLKRNNRAVPKEFGIQLPVTVSAAGTNPTSILLPDVAKARAEQQAQEAAQAVAQQLAAGAAGDGSQIAINVQQQAQAPAEQPQQAGRKLRTAQ